MPTGKNPYGVSFIQTASGAMVTGEIKRYDTYKEMMEETAPTRLASVSNASRDTDYNVPTEHQGGILYQRDYVNSTWILLYTDADLAIPTMVEWNHILHVPAWVGGVSNNRVKLVQNTVGVPRTTYYSFGNKSDLSKPYRLLLPVTGTEGLQLGDEIVLEQYENTSIVLYEKPEGVEAYEYEQTIVDSEGKTYFYLYTTPWYTFDVDSQGKPVANTVKPWSCNSYKFIYTETDAGVKVWRPVIVKDNIAPIISKLKQIDTNHVLDEDPHPAYLLRRDARDYFSVSTATEVKEGLVRLSIGSDLDNMVNGAVAVTPFQMVTYINNRYVKTLTSYNEDKDNLIVTPVVLKGFSKIDHNHDDRYAKLDHKHVIDDVDKLQIELDKKQDKLAEEGRYIKIEDDIVNCTIPDATIDEKGIVALVDTIDNSNKDRNDVAVTPAALDFSEDIEEHILADGIRPADTSVGEPAGKYMNQTMGWIKYPSLKSKVYPGYCLAMAWGWTTKHISMPAGLLEVPITGAYKPNGDLLGQYCVFHRIIHADFSTISNSSNLDLTYHYRLAFGPPTADGTDIKGIDTLLVYVLPITNPTASHPLQVYWKVLGYVLADGTETWSDQEIVTKPNFTVSYSPTGDSTAVRTTAYDGMPVGSIQRTHDAYEKETRVGTITYTISRVPSDMNGMYILDGLKFMAKAEAAYKDHGNAKASVYMEFNNVQIDMRNRTMDAVKIIKKNQNGTIKSWTETVAMGTGSTKTIASVESTLPNSTRTAKAYFKVSYDANKIQLIATCSSWSQKDSTEASRLGPAVRCLYIKPNDPVNVITCQFKSINSDIQQTTT